MLKISIPKITTRSGEQVTYCPGPRPVIAPAPAPVPPSSGGGGSQTATAFPCIKATYDVTSTTSTTKLLYSSNYISYGIDRMIIDGEEEQSVTSFRFNEKGTHAVDIYAATAGNSSFYGCTNLVSVVLPSGMTRIGNQAFSACSRLRDITLPDTITNVGTSAFDSFSDGIIRINGQLTDTLRSIITKYFVGCQLYINGTSSGTIK